MTRTARAKVVASDPRPKRPKVDRGAEREALVRQMFALEVDEYFEEMKKDDPKAKMPDKEVRGDVVDNLTAQFSSAIETTVAAATDCYLSTGVDDEEGDVDCPECGEALVLEEDAEEGDPIQCPACKHEFELELEEDEESQRG